MDELLLHFAAARTKKELNPVSRSRSIATNWRSGASRKAQRPLEVLVRTLLDIPDRGSLAASAEVSRVKMSARAGSALSIIAAGACMFIASSSRGQGPDATLLLERCLHAQQMTNRMSMQGVTDGESESLQPEQPRRQRDEFTYRRDEDLLDIAGRHLFLDKHQDRSYRFRAVIGKEYWVYYQCPASGRQPPRDGSVSRDRPAQLASYGGNVAFAAPLDGYSFVPGGQRLAEAMLRTGTFKLRGPEKIDGTSCQVVEARTPAAKMAIWIAEDSGYAMLRAEAENYPEGVPESQRHYGPNGPRIAAQRIVLEDVVVSPIKNTPVPVSGRLVSVLQLEDGREDKTTYHYHRSKIELAPDFTGTDAFVTDLPDGSSVTNFDEARSGVHYVWRGGQVVPEGGGFSAGRPQGHWSRSSWWTILAWTVLCGLLLAVGIWLVLRMRGRMST